MKKSKYVGVKIRTHIEQSFDFIIILENEILSFGCKRWDHMNDWVNCLKSKLRELKVLSPKENFYSRPPAMKPLLQKTRNPRYDPLPECPINSSLLVERIPGLEVQQQRSSINLNERNTTEGVTTVDEQSAPVVETQAESSFLVESCTISENADDELGDGGSDSVTIPIFNFANSNTSSQNLINLLSNPLQRHRNSTQNVDFTSARNDEGFLDVNDDEDEEEKEENEINNVEILPTSLNIEYIAPQQQQQQDENITIIPVSAESFNGNVNEANAKVDDIKITKIKIEVDYDYLYKATSSPIPPSSNRESIKIPSPLPTTSSNGGDKEVINIKSAPCTPRKQLLLPLTPKSTPVHEKRKSLREQQVFQLRQEINNEIRFKLRKKDAVDAVAFVSFREQLWIAGFKANPQLYVFHVGDQLLAINNIANIKSNADAQKYIKMCGGLFVEITIRRLPLAEVFVLKRDFENQCLGLIRDGNSLLEIIPNSIANKSGIPARPSIEDDSIFWIITEINFRPLSLISHKKYDETDLLLNSVGLETSLLLQPSDFVAKIKKDLKAMKNYRDYTLQ